MPTSFVSRRAGGPVPDRVAAATRRRTSAAATGSSTPPPARPCTASARQPRGLVLIVRGFAQGVPTVQLARELGRDRPELLNLRHRGLPEIGRSRATACPATGEWARDDDSDGDGIREVHVNLPCLAASRTCPHELDKIW
jgi:hypothetical protein